jgi:hypothetical protein
MYLSKTIGKDRHLDYSVLLTLSDYLPCLISLIVAYLINQVDCTTRASVACTALSKQSIETTSMKLGPS